MHTSLVFSETFKKPIRSLDSRFLATRHTATSKAVYQTAFGAEGLPWRKEVWLRDLAERTAVFNYRLSRARRVM